MEGGEGEGAGERGGEGGEPGVLISDQVFKCPT